MDILSKIIDREAGASRANAQNYTSDILEAISKVKSFQKVVDKKSQVRKHHSSDTIITTTIDLSGELVVLSMAFSADKLEPYSAEILKECE